LNGSTASFTATWPSVLASLQQALLAELGEGGAHHHPAGHLHQGHAGGLGHERHGAAGARVGLDHEDLAVTHGELHVDQAPDVEGLGDARV
jgi:hypothetical protein